MGLNRNETRPGDHESDDENSYFKILHCTFLAYLQIKFIEESKGVSSREKGIQVVELKLSRFTEGF